MEFKIYTVPFSTYPRVKYASKHLDPLLRRYDEIYLPSNQTSYRDYTNKQEFKLCLQTLGDDQDIDIRSVTKQNDIPDRITEKCANVKELVRKGCLQNSFVIIVASDINEDDIPTNNNVGTICLVTDTNDSHADWYQGTLCVSKGKLYESVSAMIELILYKASGMKSKCQYLLQDLNTIFEKQQTESLPQRSKSVEDIISGEEYVPKRTSSAKERNIFETIQLKERLSEEMLGMFSRSLIPDDERPLVTDKRITKQLKEDLKNKSSSIRSCGYRGCTLIIFVDVDCDPQNLKFSLKHLLKKHKIASFSVEPLNIKEFCKVGSETEAVFDDDETRKCGTLGGFGYAKSCSGNESKTIGLVSRHVVTIGDSPATCAFIHSEGKKTGASVDIDKSFGDNHENVLDIAAISFKEDKSKFDTTYKTSDDKSAKGVLTTYTTEQMKGLPVQICGACTPLGRGTVTMPKIEGVRDRCMDENFIFVEDDITEGKENEVFCKERDSGAIVCTDDQDNPDKVQLISMVIGESIKKKGSYATLKLKEGINQVEEETNSTIKLL
ncbi:uncharacterized protein LOC132716921 isoform X2 [Ruditapes philippinarum]|uniref:uncharacterized protein LOC132716921 isoform X2 n=1 Tax=Ruditapes philippinarum TaxID=129788 RepID=UPI00295C35CD|nr:uncharacterized protein LOC132716921 isoform X2 [Ruditapes philippinarum]